MGNQAQITVCPVCGGTILGDGYSIPLHCESADLPLDCEADGNILLCEKN